MDGRDLRQNWREMMEVPWFIAFAILLAAIGFVIVALGRPRWSRMRSWWFVAMGGLVAVRFATSATSGERFSLTRVLGVAAGCTFCLAGIILLRVADNKDPRL